MEIRLTFKFKPAYTNKSIYVLPVEAMNASALEDLRSILNEINS